MQHAIRSWNGLRLWIRTNGGRTAREPVNLTLDFEQTHVTGRCCDRLVRPKQALQKLRFRGPFQTRDAMLWSVGAERQRCSGLQYIRR